MSKLSANGIQLSGAYSMGGKHSVITYMGFHSFTVGQEVTIEGFLTPGFNVTGQTVTTTAEGSFSLINPKENFTANNPLGASGMEIDEMQFSLASASVIENVVSYYYTPSSITAASVSGGIVTYTCSNSFQVGQIVSITGFTDNITYNIQGAQIMSASLTQFTVNSSSTTGTTSTTGSAYPMLYAGQTVTISGFSDNSTFNLDGVLIATSATDHFTIVDPTVFGATSSTGVATLNVSAAAYLDVREDTTYLYSSIPQYIQEWDSSNSFQLASWLDGAMSMLQPIDSWARDSKEGVGWSLLMNPEYYRNMSSIEDLNNAFAVLPWLAQLLGSRLPLIPTSVLYNGDFKDEVEYVQYLQPYVNNWINRIEYFNSFQRGTFSSFKFSLALFLTELNQLSTTIPADQIIVLERTNAINIPNLQYVPDPYSILVLVPRQYLLTGTYGNIYITSNTYGYYNTGTPSTSLYPYYNSIPQTIIASRPPSTTFFGEFLSVSIPAGITVNVLPI